MGALRDFELAGWQGAAASYEGFAGATRLFVPALIQAAGARPGMRLLDLACGTGVAAQAAADAGARVTGVDFSPAMLATARSLHPDIGFQAGDAEALPFADASFEAVVSNFGVHHFERPERAMVEVRRVLKQSGAFAFTIWAEPRDNTAWRLVYDAVAACGRPVSLPASDSGPPTAENFSRLAAAAGFGAVRSQCLTEDWVLSRDTDLVSIFTAGTVRTAALLNGQGSALPAVRAHVSSALRAYRSGDRIVLPTRAWLMSAQA